MRISGIFVVASMVLVSPVNAQSLKPSGKETYRPPAGYVPTAEVAAQIAQAVLTPVYGKDEIESQKPFHIRLMAKGVWLVEGHIPEGTLGGTFEIEIAKRDGRILRMIHYK